MPRVVFTPQLARFVGPVDAVQADAGTLREALAAAFEHHPRLRGYVLDDQGALRANVAVFVDGQRRTALDDMLAPASTVHVLQALSGG